MIHDVDETLRAIVRRDVINGSDIEVLFDAPTKDWASRRNTPTIDIYLYDIREDMRRRHAGEVFVRNEQGRKTSSSAPPRTFKLSYLVTAWTQRPEDEHRLLSSMLACFLRNDRIPADWLVGQLQENGWPLDVTIGLPPPEDRALSDVWSALGGELKPSLDLVITTPIDTERFIETAVAVDTPPRFNWSGTGKDGGQAESTQQAPGSDGSGEVARVMRFEDMSDAAPANGNGSGKKG